MTVNLGLLVVAGVLAASGVYLLMERSLVRMLLGLLLVGNSINVLIITLAGGPGNPPIRGAESVDASTDADPLAQAMILTAIVITMGVAAFVLALTYRLFVINRQDDDLEDDSEDVKIVKGSLKNFPDRDRSDDPETGADTVAGDLFDDRGNPLTPEEYAQRHRNVIETDLMPEDAAVIGRLPEFSPDEMPDEDDDEDDAEGEPPQETQAEITPAEVQHSPSTPLTTSPSTPLRTGGDAHDSAPNGSLRPDDSDQNDEKGDRP